jgi:predicted ribosome quality control (RQC) complex YloA/Tae2 family protein
VERARFAGASQVDLDRVFDMVLGEGEYLRHVILELMPPGNIVVTDGDGKIRLLLRDVKSVRRRLQRGAEYSPPPQGRVSPSDVTEKSVREILGKEKTVGSAMGRQIALPKKYVREVLGRLNLAESAPASEALSRAGPIADTIAGIVAEAMTSPNPCVAETEGGEELFAVIPKSFTLKRRAATMSALCDDLFLPSVVEDVSQQPTPEDSKRKEAEVTIQRLREQEEALLERAANLRKAAARAGSSRNASEALEILASVRSADRRVTTPPRSKEAVASSLFAMAKEAEVKAVEARTAADALSRKKFPRSSAERTRTKQLSKKKGEWYEKFRWFLTSRGKLAIGGRDAQSNALLIRRHLEDDDSVYHADLFGSPFFVLKRGAEQTQEEVLEVAQATAAFSSAWKTGLGSADAYWVSKDQVGTSAPSGEFLAKGSFMIKGKKNFVPHNLVQVAVSLDRDGRVVAGPEGAIAASFPTYLVIVPHREKASETAKKVARELGRVSESGAAPSIDDVLRALPTGGGKIVRKKARELEDKPK